MEAFAWIGKLVEALGSIVPRILIIRATHGGVRWLCGKYVKALKPGIHFYWPVITEIETIVTARQTDNLPTQVLMTADEQQIVIGLVVVYRISDIVKAIGAKNWDVSSTVKDITQAAVVEVIEKNTLQELKSDLAGSEKKLTRAVRARLRQYGVYIHRAAITDFSKCKTFKLIGAALAT